MTSPPPANHPVSTTSIERRGETFDLLADRAIWWPGRSALLVADLHWGKDETFRSRGVPLPSGQLPDELDRLRRLWARTRPDTIYLLGDLIHTRRGITDQIRDLISAWRVQIDARMILILGNHDRHIGDLPAHWAIEAYPEPLELGEIVLAHHPMTLPKRFVWAGHLHPTVRLGRGADSLRLPCFHVGHQLGVLPAFTQFSAGPPISPHREDEVYAIAEGHVVKL